MVQFGRESLIARALGLKRCAVDEDLRMHNPGICMRGSPSMGPWLRYALILISGTPLKAKSVCP